MSRDLLASAEAEKSAVMAETDEASEAFAAQSTQAAHKVETGRQALEPLLGSSRQEAQLFREFSRCWEQLQVIDREVLSLAVQNTNLKALRWPLALPRAMQRMETALTGLMEAASPPQRCWHHPRRHTGRHRDTPYFHTPSPAHRREHRGPHGRNGGGHAQPGCPGNRGFAGLARAGRRARHSLSLRPHGPHIRTFKQSTPTSWRCLARTATFIRSLCPWDRSAR